MNDELAKVREWVQEELDAEHAAPWETRRYLQVVVLIDELLASQAAPIPFREGNIVHVDFTRCRATRLPQRLRR
ncbi:MAG TPA: hypothetical protein VK700_03555 [Steroidobacteraceae bacterium]|jgi:hypothetical protein|nr:hypothetical protein [Steroidobacteraceae bacterium]